MICSWMRVASTLKMCWSPTNWYCASKATSLKRLVGPLSGAGLEALFVADGVHGEETRPYTAEHMEALFTRFGAKASAVTRAPAAAA